MGDVPVHRPVLLREVLSYLEPPHGDALMVDGTLGEGGHSAAFLEKFPGLRVIGVDRDAEIAARAAQRLEQYKKRVSIAVSHSRDFFADYRGDAPDVILLDLGVSLFHYELSGRGFSFAGAAKDEPLDMRLDRDGALTAAAIIARYKESALADMLFVNGGERASRRIARLMCEERKRSAIATTGQLAEIVHRALGPRSGRIDSATRTFAALRIEVNAELSLLEPLLEAAFACLKTGGRLGVISFHSAEDRIVKNVFKRFASGFSCDGSIIKGRIVTKKPVVAADDEIAENPPSRSAKLRVIEKIPILGVRGTSPPAGF
ncbi:MAG: 16S rRNA (cytosine(1402)-N(4))-methyltransferase RsmH [Spirochaetaceae bacterium]|jgi:16S rRNA (cytosine1402-N4)-methyltransferase|nr:16S rRNA (cytosine(1402)-N(4))-methyltransferase RsmH [Spirochaetaceae bacterium]